MPTMTKAQLFVEEGILFSVDTEQDGKFVVDIALDRGVSFEEVQNWARVVGRFDTLGDAITAAKYEIRKL